MRRMIDNPDAQKTVTCMVDRSVLRELLDRSWLCAETVTEELRIAQYLEQVESGERVSLTAKDWEGRE